MVFSVCVTTYNRPALALRAALRVLGQTFADLELIIVDDASKPNHFEWLVSQLPDDDRISIHRNSVNRGLAYSRNVGIEVASGEYFCFCDDDDTWEKDYLATLYPFIIKAPRRSYISGSVGRHRARYYDYKITSFEEAIFQGYTPPVGSQCFCLETLKRIGGYRDNILSGVDHDLWITMAIHKSPLVMLPFAKVKPNSNLDQPRMTTSYTQRLGRIEDSLILWKDDLEKLGGAEFYERFIVAYRAYLFYSFFIQFVRAGNIKQLFVLTFEFGTIKNFRFCIRKIFKHYWDRELAVIKPQFEMSS